MRYMVFTAIGYLQSPQFSVDAFLAITSTAALSCPPDELLQLLLDVFAVMDDAMECNVREVERDVLLPKVGRLDAPWERPSEVFRSMVSWDGAFCISVGCSAALLLLLQV